MFKFNLKNPLYIGRDYRFHDNLTKVSNELYKDKIISKEEKDAFIRIYDDEATFENLRKLLHNKYKEYHSYGEWFYIKGDLKKAIDKLTTS